MGIFDVVFQFMSRGVFSLVDVNKNGVIEDVEVEVAILQLYNQVNKRLPGWQNPPSRDAIRKALSIFDTNKDGVLSQREFEAFSKDLVQCGPDAFFKRTAQNYLITTGVLPAAAVALKKLASNELGRSLGIGAFSGTPAVILAPALGATVKMIRGLIPI